MSLEKEISSKDTLNSEKTDLTSNPELISESLTKDDTEKIRTKESPDQETSIDDFKNNICGAGKKDRRRCPVVISSYESCCKCPFVNPEAVNINLGNPELRGGIETSADSAAWRKNKLIYGIPHGDD